MIDLLILLFLAAMAVGWSLALVVYTVISVDEYFFDRRVKKREEEQRVLNARYRGAAAP